VDILRGRYIHGGVDRQGGYNQIIIQLIKGDKGTFSSVKELIPLFFVLRETSFQSLNVDRNKNEFERQRIVDRARSRINGIYALGTGLIAAVATSYGIWSYHQNYDHEFYFDDAVLTCRLMCGNADFDGLRADLQLTCVAPVRNAVEMLRARMSATGSWGRSFSSPVADDTSIAETVELDARSPAQYAYDNWYKPQAEHAVRCLRALGVLEEE
jgi:hypothetical protein